MSAMLWTQGWYITASHPQTLWSSSKNVHSTIWPQTTGINASDRWSFLFTHAKRFSCVCLSLYEWKKQMIRVGIRALKPFRQYIYSIFQHQFVPVGHLMCDSMDIWDIIRHLNSCGSLLKQLGGTYSKTQKRAALHLGQLTGIQHWRCTFCMCEFKGVKWLWVNEHYCIYLV